MKVAVLASGGVDSSVAMYLLKKKYDLKAFYLKIWLEDELAHLGHCPWEEDLEYVRAVCDQLDVPLEVITMQTEYLDRVVGYAVRELKKGRTPSSDLYCNQQIKFGAFYDKIDKSYEKIASGHYAQIEKKDGQFWLKQVPDKVKDQTYFLARLSQEQLSRAMFPIGEFNKSEVREIAEQAALPTMHRKDSQGICFLGKIKYKDFVKFHLGEKQGDIIEKKSKKKIGNHNGVWFYTIGQRQGLGLSGGPWFVSGKDLKSNELYIAHKNDFEERMTGEYVIGDVSWIIPPPPNDQVDFEIKLRHGPESKKARLTPIDSGYHVKLSEPDASVAPGQFSILYRDGYCLGAGVIQ